VSTVLQTRPRQFVNTPNVEKLAARALRFLQSGYSIHLRGPAGTGKTTLALHLASLLARPTSLIYGDDEFRTSDLIGSQSGYTRKKVVDNYIHSVVKMEDELTQRWVDSRLTMACRDGFTLVYDEFNRSRPEVNNVLLSALEEKLLVLPPDSNRTEYLRVHPQFRAILTSNPQEYCGVHSTQDALMDRLVTMDMPEPDELTQQEILVQKAGIEREGALMIVRLVKAYRAETSAEKSSGLRSCMMIAKVCHEHNIVAHPEDADFREVCGDVLLSRSALSASEAKTTLWAMLDQVLTAPTPSTSSSRSKA
jgi:gas vesicle protein GvpN